jgi:hypothetical protein
MPVRHSPYLKFLTHVTKSDWCCAADSLRQTEHFEGRDATLNDEKIRSRLHEMAAGTSTSSTDHL